MAVDIYLKPDDPDRVIVPLHVENARILDFRTPDVEEKLGLKWRDTAVPWQDQRSLGLPATSWKASDGARAAGADGMIYPSRSFPNRWHLVLFRWNIPGAPILREDGTPEPFVSG